VPAQPNQSLADGITLLGLLCATGRLGTREAAERLGWELTRTNRMLGTLRDIGLAEQNSARQYLPGPGIHILAAQCLKGSGLLASAMPILDRQPRTSLGIAIGVLWRGSVCYLMHSEAGASLEDRKQDITPYPADQSSIGLILEAYGVSAEPVNSPGQLAVARAQGYAIHEDGLGKAGHGSIAVAIAGRPGAAPIAGLAYFGDLRRNPPAKLVPKLTALAAEISAAHLLAISQ
jgi:DNA-binding IclR family transcriptional regulator